LEEGLEKNIYQEVEKKTLGIKSDVSKEISREKIKVL
jgi:hypothetical protein